MHAISPVIAVLLMIVIAVAASLVAYAWVMGYLGFTTAKVGKAIQIQSISYDDPDPTYMTVYVQNVGDSDLTVSDIYVDGVQDNTAPLAADLGTTETQGFILEQTWATQPAQVTVKVVTTDGISTELKKTFTSGAGGDGGTTQYTITVDNSDPDGNISPGTGSYAEGSTPSFTITPNTDYQIESITANGSLVTVTTPAGQIYTFPPLSGPATLAATFEEIPPSGGTFGNTADGSASYSQSIEDTFAGSAFTTPGYTVTAESISAWVYVTGGSYNMKAAIYTLAGDRVGSSSGTQQVTVTTANDNQFVVFEYSAGTEPTLAASTQYVLVVWTGNVYGDTAYIYGSSNSGIGRREGENYDGTFPSDVGYNWDGSNTENYSIYCTYSIP
jgi:FlaG/FlaF family flagellin (archaellin)